MRFANVRLQAALYSRHAERFEVLNSQLTTHKISYIQRTVMLKCHVSKQFQVQMLVKITVITTQAPKILLPHAST